jgi:hypothetical protein
VSRSSSATSSGSPDSASVSISVGSVMRGGSVRDHVIPVVAAGADAGGLACRPLAELPVCRIADMLRGMTARVLDGLVGIHHGRTVASRELVDASGSTIHDDHDRAHGAGICQDETGSAMCWSQSA